MNILFISPVFSGGIGGHAAMLAGKLSDYGYKVKKMQVPHRPIKNLKNPSFALFSSLKSLTNRESFDIVHGFNIPSAYAMKYAKGKKKVLSIHGVFSEQVDTLHSKSISSVAKIAEAQVLNWPDKLTTDSKATQKLYKEKFGLNVEYLPSPLDIQKFSDISDVTKIENQVAYVGRDSYEKGIDILKQAESKINCHVIYCTDRSWDDAMKIIKSSQVVVVPSRMESLPTTVKEAFYLNVPVVATNVGGIPELMIDGETGYLVEKDNADDLFEKLSKLIIDQEKAKEMGKLKPKFNKNHKIRFDANLLEKFSKVVAKKANELKIFPEVLASKKDLLSMIKEKSNAKLLTG